MSHPTQHVPWHRTRSSRPSLCPPLGPKVPFTIASRGGPRVLFHGSHRRDHLSAVAPSSMPAARPTQPVPVEAAVLVAARRWARTAARVASACRSFLSPLAAIIRTSNDAAAASSRSVRSPVPPWRHRDMGPGAVWHGQTILTRQSTKT
jgi:hypothetical protein